MIISISNWWNLQHMLCLKPHDLQKLHGVLVVVWIMRFSPAAVVRRGALFSVSLVILDLQRKYKSKSFVTLVIIKEINMNSSLSHYLLLSVCGHGVFATNLRWLVLNVTHFLLLTSDVQALLSPTDPRRSHIPSSCSWWKSLKRKIMTILESNDGKLSSEGGLSWLLLNITGSCFFICTNILGTKSLILN